MLMVHILINKCFCSFFFYNFLECSLILRTNSKEYHLKAENHEALMIWLLGLQVRKINLIDEKKKNNKNETYLLNNHLFRPNVIHVHHQIMDH